MKKNSKKGITLIALIITIIVLLILVGVSIASLVGENGILIKVKESKEKEEKEEATEILKLKMADCQIESMEEKRQYPTLSYLAAFLNEDDEIEYVEKQSKSIATLDVKPYEDWDKIYTKLAKYPYEFEINGSFQIAMNGEPITIPSGYMKIPTEEMEITENANNIDVLNYARVNVNVPTKIPDTDVKKIPNVTFKPGNHHYDIGFKPAFIFYFSSDGVAWAFEGDTSMYWATANFGATGINTNTIVMDETGFSYNFDSSKDVTVDMLYAIK